MIIRKEEREVKVLERARGGEGSVEFNFIRPSSGLPTHYKAFAESILKKGCSLGRHNHEGESEIYYVLEGRATVIDGDEEAVLCPGDTLICYDQGYHGVKNESDELLKMLAIVVTND